MTAAFLLCAAMLAADNPALVQAKVLYSSEPRNEQVAHIETWISRAAVKSGSPLVLPLTGWIALTVERKRLHESNGFIMDGKATERNGMYEVEIAACDGGPLDKNVTLKRGERRVVILSNDLAPDNVLLALEAPVSEQAKKRAEAMQANAKSFQLELNYNGQQRKPFYRMIVSVPVVSRLRSSPFERIVQITEDEAIEIIDQLARGGFLDKAIDLRTKIKIPAPSMPGYTMKVVAGDMPLYEDLGWGLPMIHRLDALRNALPDNGKNDLDLLLGRLSGLQAQWEAEDPPFEAAVGREDSRVLFSAQGSATIIDIASKFGIDKATIKRQSHNWPGSIVVRLHLSGLELFNVGNGGCSVDWSVSSTGDSSSRVFLRSRGDETALDTKSPYYTPVRIVGDNGKIPLGKDGYFEVPLPAKLFENNPNEITLKWIDFYRN